MMENKIWAHAVYNTVGFIAVMFLYYISLNVGNGSFSTSMSVIFPQRITIVIAARKPPIASCLFISGVQRPYVK